MSQSVTAERQIFWSPSQRAFLAGELHEIYKAAGNWPDDATRVSEKIWQIYTSQPPPLNHQLGDNKGQPGWVPMAVDLTALRLNKIQELQQACAKSIVAGFNHSELARHYPQSLTDQANLNAAVTNSLLGTHSNWTTPLWCEDTHGKWEFVQHTVDQVQQVGRAAREAIIKKQEKLRTLINQVNVATDPAAISNIRW